MARITQVVHKAIIEADQMGNSPSCVPQPEDGIFRGSDDIIESRVSATSGGPTRAL